MMQVRVLLVMLVSLARRRLIPQPQPVVVFLGLSALAIKDVI